MFFKKLTISFLLLGVASSSYAQDSLLLRNYQFVKQHDAWLTSSNGAGLAHFQQPNISEAELSLQYATGGLTQFGGASNVLQATAGVESFYRISQRTVVFGAISYDNWTGRGMTGSVFMQNRLPFDIMEQTEENSGKKHRDTYRLSGAVGVDLWRGYSIGARIDYTAANYAKYKDLRHSNKLMDLTLSAGATAPIASWLTLGANYLYHRTTESVTFSVNGRNDRVFKSIIAYGAFMGRSEQFGNTGYTDSSREMPLVEDQNGGSFQLEVQPFQHTGGWLKPLSIYADVTLLHGKGYYGRKSPYTITYTNHQRDITSFSCRLAYRLPQTHHILSISYADEKLKNYAENYRELTNDHGSHYYQYYDPTETADKHWYNFNADYTLHLGIRGEQPTWTITAGCHWQQRKQTAYLYPYYRHQQLSTTELTASVRRTFLTHSGLWIAALNGAYQKGSGNPYTDGTYTTPSEKQTAPASMESYLYEDYHLLTSPQYTFSAEGRYAFRFPGTQLLTHVRANLQYRRATTLAADYCGRSWTAASIAVGCTF